MKPPGKPRPLYGCLWRSAEAEYGSEEGDEIKDLRKRIVEASEIVNLDVTEVRRIVNTVLKGESMAASEMVFVGVVVSVVRGRSPGLARILAVATGARHGLALRCPAPAGLLCDLTTSHPHQSGGRLGPASAQLFSGMIPICAHTGPACVIDRDTLQASGPSNRPYGDGAPEVLLRMVPPRARTNSLS